MAFQGAVMMQCAVALGAFGAHALRSLLTPEMLEVWRTAVNYQMAHALGLLLIAALAPVGDAAWLRRGGTCLLAGIALFSGSLYALALTGWRPLGVLTPFGGAAFMFGWLFVILAFYPHNSR